MICHSAMLHQLLVSLLVGGESHVVCFQANIHVFCWHPVSPHSTMVYHISEFCLLKVMIVIGFWHFCYVIRNMMHLIVLPGKT